MASASPPAPPPAPPRFERYGRYVLVDRLGAGGMAEVFRAVAIGAEQFQRVVVIKRILPHLSDNPSFVHMFIDEATLCGRLSHPNIIQVHEFGKQEGTYFIAMEYVEGRNLAAVLGRMASRAANVPVNVVADVARHACLGLAYAHALTGPDGSPLGIIHRDITPSNVMISYGGAVKLLDFGIARVASEARLSSTDAGQVKGKSSYLAPELVRQGPLDGRVDLFSMGIVLHEALTGRRLFKGQNPLQTIKLIQEMPIVPPSKVNAAVPPHLDEIVMRALDRDPNRRFQTALEMAEALESLLLEQRHSSQEIGRFMRGLFEADRANEPPIPYAAIHAFAREPAQAPAAVETSTGTLAFEAWPDVGVAIAARRKRRLLAAGAAMVALLALGGLQLARRARTTVPPAAPAAARAPVSTVRISFSSEPPLADVWRVGEAQPLGRTPFAITVPRGSTELEFRVTKEGFVPGLLKIIPDDDRPTLISLAPAAPPVVARPEPPRPRPRRAGADGQAKGKIRNAVPIDPFAR
jgi:serine/threonine-protein kinase